MRNPGATRQAILAAALTEFAAVGRAGARVERIARAAGVNKRMLYHYFGDKDGLCDALLRETRRAYEASAHVDESPGECFARIEAALAADPRSVRLLMWEALDPRAPSTMPTAVPSGVRPRTAQVELALTALAIFPLAFPRLVQAIAGVPADEPAFLAARTAFLRDWIERLEVPEPRQEVTQKSRVKVRLRANVVDR